MITLESRLKITAGLLALLLIAAVLLPLTAEAAVTTSASDNSTWYLAEGSNAWLFGTYITIENPNGSAVTADVTYMPTGRANVTEAVNLPAASQTTLTGMYLVSVMGGYYDFSTKVVARGGEPIAVDRTMNWMSKIDKEQGLSEHPTDMHSSVGVTSPATTWYLPEGSSAWGFECWLLIQNPSPTEATCQVTYMIEGENPQRFYKEVPAKSRQSYSMADDIGNKDASIKVTSDVGVIPERAMYRNVRGEGHDSIGTTTPAADYYLAEGSTAWGFTTYVLVQNPNPDPTDVTITYMTPEGPKPQAPFPMDPNSRKTIKVNEVAGMGATDFSTAVHGSRPIIAERSMYWNSPGGEKCHDSIGMDSPHTTFCLPDGETSVMHETWTLVLNPNSAPVDVKVTYLTASGTGNVTFTDTIPASSRQTYKMNDKMPSGRASTMVTSKTPGKKIMVERAMYRSTGRMAGTDTIGGYSD